MFELSDKGKKKLEAVNCNLADVVYLALELNATSTDDPLVVEGLRTKERQQQLLAECKSCTTANL